MKLAYTIVCRGSWLSLAQVELFKKKLQSLNPEIILHTVIKETKGDKEQSTPLHLLEGKDFFTAEIQDELRTGAADFAVHSMKDVSGELFFGNSFYRVIDRDDIRDVAIFNDSIIRKISAGLPITIGTSSPRRTAMATEFLKKALPKLHEQDIQINALPIRGNVDTRLKKLTESGQYDGIILAVAGLNRLLNYAPAKETVQQLLKGKRLMFLPLFECPPAAGQGAIVAETNLDNQDAIYLLEKISNEQQNLAIIEERKYANKYGFGCSRPFGVFHYDGANTHFTFATGLAQDEKPFTEWNFDRPILPENAVVFSGSDYMRSFYSESFLKHTKIDNSSNALFITSHKALHSEALVKQAQKKRIWCAGARTWSALAKKGIWVEGSADGLGVASIQSLLNSSLVNLCNNEFCMVTNNNSVVGWLSEGWKAVASYTLHPQLDQELVAKIASADFIFWASFQQYQAAGQYATKNVQHACPSGKTAKLLLEQGLKPIIFPTIKAFQAWRTSIS